MKQVLTPVAVVVALTALSVVPTLGQEIDNISWEASLGANYTNNLLSEASGVDDSYSNSRAALYLFPFSTVRCSFSADYTFYGNTSGLSNTSGNAGLSWIPTSQQSRTSFSLEANTDFRQYRSGFREFDNRNVRVTAGVGYELSSTIRIRGGLVGRLAAYPNADTATESDYRQAEVFAGFNLSLPLGTSLDIEGGAGLTGYSYIDASRDSVLPQFANPADYLVDGDFSSVYVSPRLSRSLGMRTGVSLTYTYRQFDDVDNSVVPGYSTDFLSPWAAFFESQTIALQIKTFLVPTFTVTAGIGYWDKTYLRTLELVTEWIEPYPGAPLTEITRYEDPREADAREDELTRLYVSLQRVFLVGDVAVEPSLSFDYSDNRSSSPDYDYSSTAVGLSLNFRP